MSYPDYVQREARRAEKNAELFASVGLGWLSGIESRRAQRIQNGTITVPVPPPKKNSLNHRSSIEQNRN